MRGTSGAASGVGPFSITDYSTIDGTPSYVDTTGRTLNNSPISAGERALILLNVSQSNAGNWMASNYTVTNTGDVFSRGETVTATSSPTPCSARPGLAAALKAR
jgi:hypothetical protein